MKVYLIILMLYKNLFNNNLEDVLICSKRALKAKNIFKRFFFIVLWIWIDQL